MAMNFLNPQPANGPPPNPLPVVPGPPLSQFAQVQAPPTNAPTPAASPNGNAKGGWEQFIGHVTNDPNAMGFLFALGQSLAGGRSSGSPAMDFSKAIGNGFAFMGLLAQAKRARQQVEFKRQQQIQQAQTAQMQAQADIAHEGAQTAIAQAGLGEQVRHNKAQEAVAAQVAADRSKALDVQLRDLTLRTNAAIASAHTAEEKQRLTLAQAILNHADKTLQSMSQSMLAAPTPEQANAIKQSAIDEAKGVMGQLGLGPMAAPQVGEIRQGYKFKGGDPSNQNSWEKVQ